MDIDEVIARLRRLSDPEAIVGMARYGINPEHLLGISIPKLRSLAKELGKDHKLAGKLWDSGLHEARLLAGMVDDPKLVDEAQLERWTHDFDSWDVCDGTVMNLFEDTPFAWSKAVEWSAAQPEFVKRTGFVLMARLAVSDKRAPNEKFSLFLPIIKRESGDDRNFVKKAVNWALRQIGKRNPVLHETAVATACEIAELDSRSARWIAKDALRELTSDAVLSRINR